MVKYAHKYADEKKIIVYQGNYGGYYNGIQKMQIVRWCGIFTDRIIDGVFTTTCLIIFEKNNFV